MTGRNHRGSTYPVVHGDGGAPPLLGGSSNGNDGSAAPSDQRGVQESLKGLKRATTTFMGSGKQGMSMPWFSLCFALLIVTCELRVSLCSLDWFIPVWARCTFSESDSVGSAACLPCTVVCSVCYSLYLQYLIFNFFIVKLTACFIKKSELFFNYNMVYYIMYLSFFPKFKNILHKTNSKH
jgi:hypothetical protein